MQTSLINQTSSIFVVLKVTQACNMACRYCSTEKDFTKVQVLTGAMGRAVIDALARLGLSSYSVCFHGGEPLLGINAVQETVEYAKNAYSNLNIRFSIQSNLVRMTEDIARWCNKHQVSVGFSIDGIASINDYLRVFHDGSGTTNATLSGLEILQRYQPAVGCVAVIGAHNWDKISGFIDFLTSNGVYQLSLNRLAPVGRGYGCYEIHAFTDEQYITCLRDSYLAMVRSGFKVKVKPIIDWARKIIDPASQSHGCYPCGAGWSHIAIDPEGQVYACDRFSFDPNWVSGNILTSSLIDILNDSKMVACRTRISRISQCTSCNVGYVCGGSCAVTSYYHHGTIDLPGHECGNMQQFIPWLLKRLENHSAEKISFAAMMLGYKPEDAFSVLEGQGDVDNCNQFKEPHLISD